MWNSIRRVCNKGVAYHFSGVMQLLRFRPSRLPLLLASRAWSRGPQLWKQQLCPNTHAPTGAKKIHQVKRASTSNSPPSFALSQSPTSTILEQQGNHQKVAHHVARLRREDELPVRKLIPPLRCSPCHCLWLLFSSKRSRLDHIRRSNEYTKKKSQRHLARQRGHMG